MSSRTTQAEAELTARRQAAETMAEAAQAWLACLDAGQRTAACGPGPDGRRLGHRTASLVLHPHRSRRPDREPAAIRPAARRHAPCGLGAVHRRVRHGRPDHGPGERPGPNRGFRRALRPGTRPGSRNVLPQGLRRTRRTRRVGMAVRRPSCLPQLPHRRRRGDLHHALLHGRRPGVLPLLGEMLHRPLGRVEDLARNLSALSAPR